MRGLTVSHWPFKLGYFAPSAARAPPIVSISAAAAANTPVELPHNMMVLPALSVLCLVPNGRNSHAAQRAGYAVHPARGTASRSLHHSESGPATENDDQDPTGDRDPSRKPRRQRRDRLEVPFLHAANRNELE